MQETLDAYGGAYTKVFPQTATAQCIQLSIIYGNIYHLHIKVLSTAGLLSYPAKSQWKDIVNTDLKFEGGGGRGGVYTPRCGHRTVHMTSISRLRYRSEPSLNHGSNNRLSPEGDASKNDDVIPNWGISPG